MGDRLLPPLFEPVSISLRMLSMFCQLLFMEERTSESVDAFSRGILRRGLVGCIGDKGHRNGEGATTTAGRGTETSAITGDSALSISRSAAALAWSAGRSWKV